MAEYRLSPAAQRDLDGIFDYTVAQWGLAQALRYTDLIEAACAELAEAPLLAQDCSHIRPGCWRQGVARHIMYFVEQVMWLAWRVLCSRECIYGECGLTKSTAHHFLSILDNQTLYNS